MQPIYLLSVSNGLKQLFTFFVFGFDLKFKPKTGTAKTKVMKFILSSVVKMWLATSFGPRNGAFSHRNACETACLRGFIALAVNSIVHDYQRLWVDRDLPL